MINASAILNGKPGVGDERRGEILESVRKMGGASLIKSAYFDKGNINFVIMKVE